MEAEGVYSADYDMKKIRAKEAEEEKKKNDVNLIVFDDDYMLDSDTSDIEGEEEEIKKAAKLYLDQGAQDNIDIAIQEAKNAEIVESTDCWNQEFFRAGSKSIRQPNLISLQMDKMNSEKEITISELSASKSLVVNAFKLITNLVYIDIASKGRNFLFNLGCMKDWHRGGWICPNYIYQWVFEVGKLSFQECFILLYALLTLYNK